MPTRFDLENAVCAVIGGTGTLGGAMAHGLAAHRGRVVVLGRNAERGETRAGAIRAEGGSAAFVPCDAGDRHSLGEALATIEQTMGPCEVLVSCAGGNDPRALVTPDQPVADLDDGAVTDVFRSNVMAGLLLPAQIFAAPMLERGRGSVINIASVSAHVAISRVIAYSAAKAAVLNLTQFLAREWATRGVRVNSITPGFFLADQNRALLQNPDGTPTARARSVLAHTPMARMGEPDELIGAAVFLASHAASGFVTGTDIRVDGGFLSMTI